MSGGYDKSNAETDIELGVAGLVAFVRSFINNPDLVEMWNDLPLSSDIHQELFYIAEETGYTDYPVYLQESVGV